MHYLKIAVEQQLLLLICVFVFSDTQVRNTFTFNINVCNAEKWSPEAISNAEGGWKDISAWTESTQHSISSGNGLDLPQSGFEVYLPDALLWNKHRLSVLWRFGPYVWHGAAWLGCVYMCFGKY